MPPEQTPNQDPRNTQQTAQQPWAPNTPQPAYGQQAYQQSPVATNHAMHPEDVKREKLIALLLAIGSLAVFAIGFLIGIAALLGAVLGAIGAQKSWPIRYMPGLVIGIVGCALNAGFYALVVLNIV